MTEGLARLSWEGWCGGATEGRAGRDGGGATEGRAGLSWEGCSVVVELQSWGL